MSGGEWLLVVVAVLAVLFAGAMWLAESSIRVRGARRAASDESIAAGIAPGVRWEPAAIAGHDGLPLRGWFFQPDASVWNGEAALVLHGYTDRCGGMIEQIRFFLDLGYAVLAPDSRGHGASGGEVVSFGVLESRDVPGWGDWLCQRLQSSEYVAYGQSMGAAVALLAATADHRIRAVIAESPFSTFREAAYERMAQRAGVPEWVSRTVFRLLGEVAFQYTRVRYGFDLHKAAPVKAIRRIEVPVYLVHGLADRSIHHRHSRRLKAARPAAQLWEVPGAAHTEPMSIDGPGYRRRVAEWLARKVTAGSRAS